ncbi:MAG: AAA family ATPase [Frankiaceae bacterium]|nr:AAA family ATPase [Frankiaceae bacterium]
MQQRTRGASAGFVGRDAPLRVIASALTSAAAGRGTLLLISGEAGIGKTRLTEEALRDADIPVVRAACAGGLGVPSLWPWVQVLRGVLDRAGPDALDRLGAGGEEVRRLLDDVGGAQPRVEEADGSRFVLYDAVARLLTHVADATPHVIVLEDLHWADAASIDLLGHLAPVLPGHPLLVVGTFRDDEAPAALRAMVRPTELVPLTGMTETEVADLVTVLTGEQPDAKTVDTLVRRTAGNPFFVGELLRLLDTQTRSVDGALPTTVKAVIEHRLARLATAVHDLLGTAAVLGATVEVDLLARVASLDVGDIHDLLDAAAATGLVTLDPPRRMAFVHALVRDTLYDGLGTRRRLDAHRRAAHVLQDSDADAAAAAGHWIAAATDADDAEPAIAAVVRAAEQALARLGYEEAASFYAHALDLLRLLPRDDDRRRQLLLRHGDALLRVGDLAAARATYDEAATLARHTGDTGLLVDAAVGFSSGLGGFEVRLADAHQADLLEEALAAMPADDPRRPLVLARLSVAMSSVESAERRLSLAEEAVESARTLADPLVLTQALAAHCDAIAGPAHTERRLAEADEIIALAVGAGSKEQELLGRRLRFVALMELGDPAAWAEASAYSRTAEQLRQPLYQWYVPLWQGTEATITGRYDEAERLRQEAEHLGALVHSENSIMLTEVQTLMLAIEQGQFADVEVVMDTLLAPLDNVVPVLPERALVCAHVGRDAEARAILDRARAVGYWQWDDAEWLPAVVAAAQAATLLEAHDHAEAIVDVLSPWAHRFAFEGIGAGCYGAVSRYVGQLLLLLGRYDEAAAQLEDAVRRNAAAGMPLFAGRAAAELAEARAHLGHAAPAATTADASGELRRDGDVWELTYSGHTTRLRDAKGLRDLATLLARPGQSLHVLELAGAADKPSAETLKDQAEDPVLDRTALAAYRSRLRDLDDDLDAAAADHDEGRVARLTEEREFLTAELSAALGLGGRSRTSTGATERARKAVAARLRDTIRRIGQTHEPLGRHLEHAVRTGTFCVYEPEQPTTWRIN